jgi:hypothetical protein
MGETFKRRGSSTSSKRTIATETALEAVKPLLAQAVKDGIEYALCGYRVVTPEWMVVLKYIAKRSKDRLDIMWLLQQAGLVDRETVLKVFANLLGDRAAVFPIRELQEMFAQADIAALRDRDE